MIRRAIGTTVAVLCALTGPLAGTALADAQAPDLTLSVSSSRPGIPFTINGATSCPADDGAQLVNFSFTDSGGLIFALGSVTTADDGSWSDATVQLPVAGPDDSGDWQDNGAAAGEGSIDAVCVSSDDSGDPDPGDGDDSEDSDDPIGDDPGDGSITLSYASSPLTLTGSAPQVSLSPVSSGNTVTVTPAEACAGTGAADVDLAVVPIGDDSADQVATGSATASATGSWAPVVLDIPDDATGDFAVTVTCSRDSEVSSSYDAQPLALGTVLLSRPVCTARGAVAKVSGSYSGDITSDAKALQHGVVRLTGAGPWKVTLTSAGTGQLLLTKQLACSAPMFDLDVHKGGVSDNGQVQVKVCNSGRAGVVAVLQVVKGTKGATVDTESLDPGECATLQGGKVRRGSDAKAQVLINPPGKGTSDTEVSQKFTVHRGKH